DWWLLSENQARRNITRGLKGPVTNLYADLQSRSVVCLSQGKLWRISLDGGEPQELSADSGVTFSSVTWPYGVAARRSVVLPRILVLSGRRAASGQTATGATQDLYQYDLTSGRLTIL